MPIQSFLHVSGTMVVTHSYIKRSTWGVCSFPALNTMVLTSGAIGTTNEQCCIMTKTAVMDHTAYLLQTELHCAHHMGRRMPGWD